MLLGNAFGDLFLRNEHGTIFQLNAGAGKLDKVADSETQFRELAETREKREEWFAESEETASAAQDLTPDENQCIGSACRLCSPKAVPGAAAVRRSSYRPRFRRSAKTDLASKTMELRSHHLVTHITVTSLRG